MGETLVRGDLLANRGVPLIDDTNDLCPGNVGGQIVPFSFKLVCDATSAAGTKMKFIGSTNVYCIPYKPGSVVGISGWAHTALGASRHATFTVYKGATATTMTGTLLASTQYITASKVKDAVTFAAGKKLSVLCEHASNTTYTMAATIFVEM